MRRAQIPERAPASGVAIRTGAKIYTAPWASMDSRDLGTDDEIHVIIYQSYSSVWM